MAVTTALALDIVVVYGILYWSALRLIENESFWA
jgi:hypothetical protein